MPADDFLPELCNGLKAPDLRANDFQADDLYPNLQTDDLPAENGESSFSRGMLGKILEEANPFEAVFEIINEPAAGMALLIFIVAIAVIVMISAGLWSAVQETFVGGGPPQGLGLK
jgi:hypothetical protein